MPELPEIALFKKYLDATALHKKIIGLSLPGERVLKASKKEFENAIFKNELVESRRLGKYLLVKTSGNKWLVFHFGMTGELKYYKNQDEPKYSQIILSFENDYQLAYMCRRKLGKIFLAESFEAFKEEHSLGEDALEISEEEFSQILKDKTAGIKSVLTDQQVLSGIGNVYSDEILYQSEIHPKTKTNVLSEKEKRRLFENMHRILKLAIDKDGERSEFPNDYLLRHRKEGEDCSRCKGEIVKIKISGRSTYFCPDCQQEKT